MKINLKNLNMKTKLLLKRKSKESNDEILFKFVRVVSRLIKEMKQVHGTFRKVNEDMDEVETKIDENKREISREKIFKQMDGDGLDMEMKRFYQKIMEENPNLFKDIKETMKMLMRFKNIHFSKNI